MDTVHFTDANLLIQNTIKAPLTLIVITDYDNELVRLKPDGTIEFGPKYHPDEATRIFWEHLAASNPLLPKVRELEAEVLRLTAQVCDLEETIKGM